MFNHKSEAQDALKFAREAFAKWNELIHKGELVEDEDLQALKEILKGYRKKLAMGPNSQTRSTPVGHQRYADLLSAAVKQEILSGDLPIDDLPSDDELQILGDGLQRFRDAFYTKEADTYTANLSDEVTIKEIRGAFETCRAIIYFKTAAVLYGFLDGCVWPGDPETAKKKGKRSPKDAAEMIKWMKAAIGSQLIKKDLITFDIFDAKISGLARFARTYNSSRDDVKCDADCLTPILVSKRLIDETSNLKDKEGNPLSAANVAAVLTTAIMVYLENKDRIPEGITRSTALLPMPMGSMGAIGMYLRTGNQEGALASALNAYTAVGGKLVRLAYAYIGDEKVSMLQLSQSFVDEMRRIEKKPDANSDANLAIIVDQPRAVADAIQAYCKEKKASEMGAIEKMSEIEELRNWNFPDDCEREKLQKQLFEELNKQIELFSAQPAEVLEKEKKKPLPVKKPFANSDRFWLLKMAAGMARNKDRPGEQVEESLFSKAELNDPGVISNLADKKEFQKLEADLFIAHHSRLWLGWRDGKFLLKVSCELSKQAETEK